MTALGHQKPDRPPLNYFGTPETTKKLLEHLSLGTHEDLLCYFGADMRYVSPEYVGPSEFSGACGYSSGGTDMWGVPWRTASNDYCTYTEVASHPLAHATTLEQLREYPWPSPDWLSVAHLKEEIRSINRSQQRAIVLPTGMFFETAWFLRGFEQLMLDFMEQPDIAEFILMKVTRLQKEVTMRAVEASDGQIDIVWSNSDVGMQDGMMFSPELWRKHIKPWHRELIEPFREMGLRTRYHTDGGVTPIIDDLIEMGLDLLDPIQPKAKGMDAENLMACFGGRISFYGGVDTQELLPFGTADQVESEVLRLIDVLGSNGGYVVAASNAVQPDVPIENVLALYRTAREYR
jgi:uroporphyrinogen decarboxylase